MVWSAPTTDARLKKRIVRTLITRSWPISTTMLPRSLSSSTGQAAFTARSGCPSAGVAAQQHIADIIAAVAQLALIASDDLIAGLLNRNGLKTGHGNRWTRERVTSLRSHHRIPVFKATRMASSPGSISPTPHAY